MKNALTNDNPFVALTDKATDNVGQTNTDRNN